MPRFTDAYLVVLNTTMLSRVPGCLFTEEDIQFIAEKTGLDVAQIQQWARNFRLRVPSEKRGEFLRGPRPEQVFLSYYLCFQVFPLCFVW